MKKIFLINYLKNRYTSCLIPGKIDCTSDGDVMPMLWEFQIK